MYVYVSIVDLAHVISSFVYKRYECIHACVPLCLIVVIFVHMTECINYVLYI